MVECLLHGGHPVSHLHLDGGGQRNLATGVGDELPRGLGQIIAVDVLNVRPQQANISQRSYRGWGGGAV